MKRIILYSLAMLLLSSCWPDEPYARNADVAYVPVYGSQDDVGIKLVAAREVNNPGKIYLYQHYLLVNEIEEGIHVFDNTDPSKPQPLGFIRIIGNTDMAIKDDRLYADYLGNLSAIAVNDFQQPELKGKLELRGWDKGAPPPSGFYFECIDSSKGVVVAWEETKNKNFDCYAY